ncbi:MAG: hypothetical protein WC614_08305 [bacterium]
MNNYASPTIIVQRGVVVPRVIGKGPDAICYPVDYTNACNDGGSKPPIA